MPPKYTEQALQNAIQDVISGMKLYIAAQRWEVPRSTIQERLKGRTSRKEAFEGMQKLPSIQEADLRGWILIRTL